MRRAGQQQRERLSYPAGRAQHGAVELLARLGPHRPLANPRPSCRASERPTDRPPAALLPHVAPRRAESPTTRTADESRARALKRRLAQAPAEEGEGAEATGTRCSSWLSLRRGALAETSLCSAYGPPQSEARTLERATLRLCRAWSSRARPLRECVRARLLPGDGSGAGWRLQRWASRRGRVGGGRPGESLRRPYEGSHTPRSS